ncbi:MAG: TetR/AcrR family transcriptional regulator, ethionamide resistance regulator [Solirubrobacterales bacterium]|jgi:AcrR family transcriptional regulator|nr:TetR/AcrR family transcriptional regulator, ethionamide resistance regulator [Solirubrobacterales bacterium]
MAATPKTRTRESRERSRQRIIEAATELVRERSYAELNVGEIMERAGIGRTIFYRHFDDLGDLLLRAGREAIDELLTAQLALAQTRVATGPEDIRRAIELPVLVYSRHGPLLRAVAEAAAADPGLTPEQAAIRRRFDELVADALHRSDAGGNGGFADVMETAHALNLLNESYLLEAFGGEQRVSTESAVSTLTEIWAAVLDSRG